MLKKLKQKLKKLLTLEFYEDFLIKLLKFFIRRNPISPIYALTKILINKTKLSSKSDLGIPLSRTSGKTSKKIKLSKNRLDSRLRGNDNSFSRYCRYFSTHHPYISAGTSFLLIISIVIGISGFLFLRNTESAAAWWNDTWGYRKAISINNSGSAQTNTQVKILDDEDLSSLVSAGKLQADLDDLRFTDKNGNLIDYWIEDDANSSVDIWAFLPSVSTTGATIYMYYGSPSVSAGKSTVGTAEYPGVSCQAILLSGASTDGAYYIDPTAQESTGKFQAYCDLNNDGGGWTMIMKNQSNTNTFHYSSGYWTSSNIYQSDDLNTNAGDSKFTSFNTLQFSYLRGCVSSPNTNCLIREFGSPKDSALALFSETESPSCTCGNDGGNLTFSDFQTTFNINMYDGACEGGPLFNKPDCSGGGGDNPVRWGVFTDEAAAGTSNNEALGWGLTNDGTAPGSAGSGGYTPRMTHYGRDTWLWVKDFIISTTGHAVTATTPSSEEKSKGPVGYWSFDEGHGNIANNSVSVNPYATGGSVQEQDGYRIHTFTSSGTFTVQKGGEMEVLTVAGGGGGGSSQTASGGGGGGGAGGLIYDSSLRIDKGEIISVVVGAGGAPGVSGSSQSGTNGEDSIFDQMTAVGGGGGARVSVNGNDGGSGGGGGYNGYSVVRSGGSGTSGQGNSGGNTSLLSWAGGAGGGGAGGIGGENKINHAGGDGGAGSSYDISGSSVMYAAGGNGGSNSPAANTPNTGYGGDAAYAAGTAYAGASGVVIVRYKTGNEGVINGATWKDESQCVSGRCLEFDGVDDYINLGNGDSIKNITDEITVSAWVKYDEYGGGGQSYSVVAAKGTPWTFLMENPNNKIRFRVTVGGQDKNAVDSETHELNRWYYFVGTYDGENIKMYKDGELVGVTPATGALSTNDVSAKIGTYTGSSYNVNGKIDEPKIYNYARTAEEIKQDYNAGLAGISTPKGTSVSIGSDSPAWMSDGLVGYWKMDESSGNIIDSSGNDNTGIVTGTTVVSSKYGNGRSFNGTNSDSIDAGSNSSLDITEEITLIAWMNPTSIVNWSGGIVKGNYETYQLKVNGIGQVTSTLHHGGNRQDYCYDIGDAAVEGSWNMIAMTYDGVGTVKTYLNGVLQCTDTKNLGAITSVSSSNVFIGSNQGYYYDGKIDEARIYNRALSPDEVKNLYKYSPGPVLHLKMDEKSGTTAYDVSGNENNGTLTNGPTWTEGRYGGGIEFDGSNGYLELVNFVNYPYTSSCWINEDGSNSWDYYVNNDEDSYKNGQSIGSLTSSKSCSEIGWPETNGSVDVCGESDRSPLVGCSGEKTYLEAKTYCEGVGARLCTYDEINNNEASGTGCSYDYENVWTSTFCESGNHWTDEGKVGSGTGEECRSDNSLAYVRCCADISPPTSASSCLSKNSNLRLGEMVNGKIDELRFYDYIIDQKQIIEDMNAGHPAGGSPVGSQVAYWKFDEGYGTMTYNSIASSGNNGTINGASWTNEGRFGKALSFDGVNDSVNFGTGDNFFPLPSFSVSIWFKSEGTTPTTGTSPGLFGLTYGIRSFVYSNRLNFGVDNGSSMIFVTSPSDYDFYNDDTWHHMVGTATSDTLKLYVDGILVDNVAFTWTGTTRWPTNGWNIGRDNNNSMYYFTGQIDEFKVYNFALDEETVKKDYNQGKSLVMGSKGTASDGVTPSFSSSREYCVPGDTSTCNPPVAEWKFDEKNGTTVYDTSGNGNDGTLTNMEDSDWQSSNKCKKGRCFDFDGSSKYVNFNNAQVVNSDEGTVEAWVNAKNWDSNRMTVFSSEIGPGWVDLRTVLFSNSNNSLTFSVANGASSISDSVNTGAILNSDNWYHIVGTYNGSEVKIYVDGVEKDSYFTSIVPGVFTPTKTMVGWHYSDRYWNGKIDGVRIYDYARTPAQIAWDYNRGKPIGHWKMDEGGGLTVHDESGNGNHGTMENMNSDDWVDGKNNDALDFDGGDDYVDCGDIDDLGDTFSVSLWTKAENFSSYSPLVFRDGNTNNNLGLRLDASGNIEFRQYGGDEIRSDESLSTDKWYHIVAVSDDLSGSIYVNGENKKSGSFSNSFDDSGNIRFGRYDYSTGYNYDGQIDDVQIYNYSLTEKQIQNIYNGGAVNYR